MKKDAVIRFVLQSLGCAYLIYFIIICGVANLTCHDQHLLLPWGWMVVKHSCNYLFH